jgi:hypothetical protein
LFAKLAKKYGATNPLDSLQQSTEGDGQSAFQGSSSMIDDSSALTVKRGNGGIALFASQPHTLDQSSSVQSHGMSTSPFGSPFIATNSATTTPFSIQAGLSTPFSAFGQGPSSSAPSTVGGFGSTVVPTSSFGGKSPRELLTAFYQEKNPSKIADVDNLLIKYQVRMLAILAFGEL